jgi:glutamyl-tRNA synthetase
MEGNLFYASKILTGKRSSSESEKAIFEALRWAGIEWDEGPDVRCKRTHTGKANALKLYEREINRLFEQGNAYRCFCTPERLNEVRAKQMANKQTPRYDGHCLGLSP